MRGAERLTRYYNDPNYHRQASDWALKMKIRRLGRLQEIACCISGPVLEVGCSIGVYSNDFHDWVGIDISRTALLQIRGKNRILATALNLPFRNNVFSLVMCFDTIEHLPDPEKALLEINRVLKPGGFLAIGSPPLIWELLLTGEPRNSERKKLLKWLNLEIGINKILNRHLVVALVKHAVSILRELFRRLIDELLIIAGAGPLPLRPLHLEPDYDQLGEDYDAVYAYNPNALVNFLRSRGFKVFDLRPFPIRVIRLPTEDVEITVARKGEGIKCP